MEVVLFIISNIIIKSTIMLFPIIPSSSKKVLSFFNLNINNINFNNFENFIDQDIHIKSPTPIFPRIE